MKKLLLGFDVGSSSIKVSIINSENGKLISSAFSPSSEMKILSSKTGWAEQNPDDWWKHLVIACRTALSKIGDHQYEIGGIGISYQMHGLVMLGKNLQVIHPSIIWCDSRAVEIGDSAFTNLGGDYCLGHCLNSPGNFTASKLKWVKENLPDTYNQLYKFMLPGDYIAYRLSGEINTTISGLSEGIFWDFRKNEIADDLIEYYGIDKSLIPDIVSTFGVQSNLSKESAEQLGLQEGIPISYRAGDQPNNAFSLNVLNPGEIATTAGTSGVVYGIVEDNSFDKFSRVNSFAHVNYNFKNRMKGVLLCINGTGILYNWLRNELIKSGSSYEKLNSEAEKINIGSDGISILPFGNGAERVLKNRNIGAQFLGVNFNNHTQAHIIRAAQEGIAFSFKYGIDIMKEMGIEVNLMRAGKANMFLSKLFSETISNTTEATVELYNTDGAQGAARGAGVGAGIYSSFEEAFNGFKKLRVIEPNADLIPSYLEAYHKWKERLEILLNE